MFFDSHCHQECPLEGRALAAAERMLPLAQRPVLVAVSVNPLDTPAKCVEGGESLGTGLGGAVALADGHAPQLAPVWAAYHIYVSPHPVNGDIAHTEAVYLVDRRGYVRSAYLYPFLSRYVTGDLHTLARGTGS